MSLSTSIVTSSDAKNDRHK